MDKPQPQLLSNRAKPKWKGFISNIYEVLRDKKEHLDGREGQKETKRLMASSKASEY